VRGTGIMVKSFRVFNRWGEVIFEKLNFAANDSRYGWDGKIRGVPAPPNVYVYTAEVVCDNGASYTYKGNTTILK
jgi:large repetitive protein